MMNSVEFSSYWDGQNYNQFLLPDHFLESNTKNEDVKDKSDFLNEISDVSGIKLEKPTDPLDDDDLFPEWMESKVDLSLWDYLDNLDNLTDLLDDPTLVTKNEGSVKESGCLTNEIPLTEDFSFNISSQELAASSVIASPPYSNPNSPEGQVPNVTPPNSPSSMTSFEFTAVSQLEKQPEDLAVNVLTPTLVEMIVTHDLNECSTLVLQEIVSSSPPSPVEESLALSYINEESVIIPLEKPVSSEAPTPRPATRGRKRKSDDTSGSETSSKTLLLAPSTSKALPKARKERKRMQNKDAATRYRQKKRQEADVIYSQEEELLDENTKLKEKVRQLSTEISYLKGLMREMFKARGIMK